MKTKADLLEAAWCCFKAAQRVALARNQVEEAHAGLRQAQNAHAEAARVQREVEEALVRQAGGEPPMRAVS